MSSRLLLSFSFATFIVGASFIPLHKKPAATFHSPAELKRLQQIQMDPIDSGQYFLSSSHCRGCHGYDPTHLANVNAAGEDVNLVSDWQTTMMAMSAKDPLWRAKVSHEILVDPGHANELQTKCTSCHAPMGHFTAVFHNQQYYTVNDILNDSLGLDGVSCGSCHMIDTTVGSTFSGDIPYDTMHVEFGPFTLPFQGPMQLYEGLTPTFSTHMNTANLCSPCHTLQTKTVDLNGNYTGNTFVEQATFHEWKNSTFHVQEKICQTCHMPRLEEPIVIANNIISLAGRSPFNQHHFTGANVFMVQMMFDHKNSLGLEQPDSDFNQTLARTIANLQTNTAIVQLNYDYTANDSAYFDVHITNKAGHKFPSGYPSRRAYLHFVLQTVAGDTIFESGRLDASHELVGLDVPYEHHHDVIRSPNDVQVYEMVMGDVNGNVTTLLERAAQFLKDNRLPPLGFTTQHPSYDTIPIVGEAFNDADFNKDETGTEGTGADIVHYHIPLNGITGLLNASVSLNYQAVPPRWVADMFTYSSAAIDTFKSFYNTDGQLPILVGADSLLEVNTPSMTMSADGIEILNNPSANGFVYAVSTSGVMLNTVQVFDETGRKISSVTINLKQDVTKIALPGSSGVYLLKLETNHGTLVKKVIRL